MTNKITAIILPAFNEDKVVKRTIKEIRRELKNKLKYDIIVVNDGSSDNTKKIAQKYADIVLTHIKNRGLGASLGTGIEYVRQNKKYIYAITFDSDNQHNPKDILKVLKQLKNYDVVIGSRFKNKNNNIPFIRKIILKISNILTYIFFGVWTSDSQSGFRGFNRHAIDKIKITTNKMEVSSEFFGEIKRNNLEMTEVPIWVKYTKYSLSKGQSNTNSLNILIKLLYKILK